MRFFTEEELACSHCGEQGMDTQFVEVVEELREELGWPFIVTSAYRCPEHPIEKKKDKPGTHRLGRAMDIQCSGEKALDLIERAVQKGFLRVGVNQRGDYAQRFIHIDDCSANDGFTAPHVWSY